LHINTADGRLIAGLDGFSWGGYVKIEWLWVHEDHRHRGLGTELVRVAEAEAARRGCDVVRVDSHTFQAPGFYEKLAHPTRWLMRRE
jgi:ribosomal protein S18 acetylase RimI-like enzyme